MTQELYIGHLEENEVTSDKKMRNWDFQTPVSGK